MLGGGCSGNTGTALGDKNGEMGDTMKALFGRQPILGAILTASLVWAAAELTSEASAFSPVSGSKAFGVQAVMKLVGQPGDHAATGPAFRVDLKTQKIEQAQFALYDDQGRFLGAAQDGVLWPGNHVFELQHAELPAGSYILRSVVGDAHNAWRIKVVARKA